MRKPIDHSAPTRSPTLGADQERQVQADLTRLLFEQAPPGLVLTAVNAALVTAAMGFVAEPLAVWTWFASLLLILAARALLLRRFRRDRAAAADAAWTRRFTLGAAATALSLAAAPQASAGVVGCKASGSKQEVGAVVGGLLGALAGNKIAGKG